MTALSNPAPRSEEASAETTIDGMFQKRIVLCQRKAGYRFSVDAVLLGLWATRFSVERSLDIGCGCGVIPLIMADLWERRGLALEATGVEIQPSLAALARDNVERNGRQGQVSIVEADIRAWDTAERWPLVTCNPPYQGQKTGVHSRDPERAAARHEIHGTLVEIFRACRRRLDPTGRLLVVFPASSLPRLFSALEEVRLWPQRLLLVFPKASQEARLALIEIACKEGSLLCEPPLLLYRGEGRYTAAMTALFQGEIASWQEFASKSPPFAASDTADRTPKP